jgi:hypothetical protein
MAADISFDDLVPSKQKDSPAPSKGADISFDDLIPKDPSKQPIVGSRMHNIGRTAVETVPAATAGLIGFGAGMELAAPIAAVVAPLTGPAAPITAAAIELIGGLGGAFVASGAAQKVTDMVHEVFAPEDYKQRQIEKAQRPYGTFAAQTATNLMGMSPKTAPEVATKILTKPIVQRGTSAGLMGGIEAGSEYAREGKIDPIKVGVSAATGAVMPGLNVVGSTATKVGQVTGKIIKSPFTKAEPLRSTDTPPPPPEGATPEQKAEFLAKTKKIKAERDASAPLVEAAIRNKETGEIERMGPKHSETRKLETLDTHEQGFVDERGNFHERLDAVDQAKRAGQIPKDHVLESPPDELPGLHSGDLRKAGDKRFEVTEDQPAGVPKEVVTSPDEIIIDRTKTSPRDVKDDKEFIDIATDIYEKHGDVEATKFFEGWQEFKKTWPEPIREVENFGGTNLNSKIANERIVHNNTSGIKELAGKDVNLEQLSFDIDKGVPLEGKAKDVATKFRTLMDDLGKRALKNDVIKGWHENYVARNVVTEGAAPKGALEEFMRDAFGYGEKASGDGTKTTTKYGQERRLKTREDLVNHIHGINSWLESKGLDYRFKIKTDNLAEIYKDYALSVEKAIENKNLIENIKQVRNVNGESLIKPITPESPLPYGWKQIDHPDLAGFAIHPDLVAPLKFVFDSGPGMTMQALGTISQAVKRINVIGSFFHAKSLLEVLSSAKIPLWTPIKEAIVLPLVEKGVKAVTGKDLQLSAISKAVEQFKKGGLGDNVDTWIREHGLQLEVPEDVSRGMLSSVGKFADTMIGKYGPKTRVLEKSMSTIEKYTLGIFDKYTWDYLHTGGKIMVADAYLEKARLNAAKEGKPFNEMAARKEIASFVNDSFGGLNWFDAARNTQNEFAKRIAMAAYSPEGRRSLQVMLFAPDWTISTIRAFSSALPKSLNPTKLQPIEGIKGMLSPTTKADYARLYQFKTAVVYLTLLNVINNMTAGRNIWDNKDPTRIEWPDGTSMQAMKHAMEPYHWIMDPDKTLSNKLGFIPKAAVVGIGGLEYASPTAEKLVDLSGTGRLKAVAKTALPFQLQAGSDAPEGEGVKRALLGTAGFPVYGSTPEQRKQKKKERDEARKANAAAYHKKAKEKGWEK